MAITLTQLQSLLAVVRTGSVTGAADALYVTQPSVSAALAALAREVGADLTERDGRSVRLTPAGAAFAEYAADVVGLLEEGTRRAREIAGVEQSELRVAAVTTAAEYLVSPLIHAVHQRWPDLSLALDVANRREVFEAVLGHRADVAIGGRPPKDERVQGTPFLANEIVIITAPDDPLAGEEHVPIEALAGRPWLLREPGSGTRLMIEEFLAEHHLEPRLLTLGSNGAIKQAARTGLGRSLQARIAVRQELEAGTLATIRIAEPLPERAWYVMRSTVGPKRELVDEFIAFLTSDAARAALAGAP